MRSRCTAICLEESLASISLTCGGRQSVQIGIRLRPKWSFTSRRIAVMRTRDWLTQRERTLQDRSPTHPFAAPSLRQVGGRRRRRGPHVVSRSRPPILKKQRSRPTDQFFRRIAELPVRGRIGELNSVLIVEREDDVRRAVDHCVIARASRVVDWVCLSRCN